MSLELPRMGHEVTVCPDGLTAVAALKKNTYDCILVDLDMPGLSGIEVMAKCKELSPHTEAIVLTGKSSLDTAIAALRQGAFDYLTKPCKLVELQALLKRVAAKREMTHKYLAVKRRLEKLEGKSQLVGHSQAMDQVRKLISKVAPTDSTVLVLGETGTGKELVARAVHDQSARAELPFVAINCGALPENLIESELFGHRKGSFTGADEHRVGLFEVADGGTLFLDEIGELPKPTQAKLLRFLESGEIRRVGENDSFTVDVRVVCATHRDLQAMVDEGDFREDLMFRINTFEIPLPPLRARTEDISELAAHLMTRFRHAPVAGDDLLAPDALEVLARHRWPGNVPRAGQRDRICHNSLRRGPDPPGALAQPIRASARLRPAAQNLGTLHAARDRNASDLSIAGTTRRQQAESGRRAGDQPEDALQQAEPVQFARQVGLERQPPLTTGRA